MPTIRLLAASLLLAMPCAAQEARFFTVLPNLRKAD